ncbi:MAG: Small MutS-related domain-containing protein [Candidatus Tokpelaia sp. JSC161]|jgi:DNA-nicking Smr family endonuclease|nr:MAG: Small MutS-related domain-containing protein [Candidatus Tokpelaia sp. JSC161]
MVRPFLKHANDLDSYRLNVFDQSLYRKIADGNFHIEARIDLHGLIQEEAHSVLLHFLDVASYSGLRYALVITGKGKGILRRVVPLWLRTYKFRCYINAFKVADRRHGGTGALYIKLRHLQN